MTIFKLLKEFDSLSVLNSQKAEFPARFVWQIEIKLLIVKNKSVSIRTEF